MREVKVENVPTEVKQDLQIQNRYGFLPTNRCTYYPNGDNPNIETNKAIVYHQLENGAYTIIERYTF